MNYLFATSADKQVVDGSSKNLVLGNFLAQHTAVNGNFNGT